ncbi:hypothetical protein AB4090_04255 [Acidithiobacillus sp. IBUN Pt1247-S3]|uniref:hypothetical protein n=1 Tax=Acidithiobacillus sp. IBUN Pt1247-S3 TaxID=3166642 RepID=UPI0034E44451
MPSLHELPRIDDVKAGRWERRNVARGDGEAASVRSSGDVAVWRGENLAGGTGDNGQLGVVPGCGRALLRAHEARDAPRLADF